MIAGMSISEFSAFESFSLLACACCCLFGSVIKEKQPEKYVRQSTHAEGRDILISNEWRSGTCDLCFYNLHDDYLQ